MRNTKTPRFQQRHYEIVAEQLAIVRYKCLNHTPLTPMQMRDLVMQFVQTFKADNPKFLPGKFTDRVLDLYTDMTDAKIDSDNVT